MHPRRSVCRSNRDTAQYGQEARLEMLGIELCRSLSKGEQLRRASELSGRRRWPSDEDMIRARAWGGGIRRPASCAGPAAASAADGDAFSSARSARLAAASTAAGSTYARATKVSADGQVEGLPSSRTVPSYTHAPPP